MTGRGRNRLVPVHGEAAHLVAQGALMAASGIPKSRRCAMATCCGWRRGRPKIIDKVPFGRIYKDGKLVGDDEAWASAIAASSPLPAMSPSMWCSTRGTISRAIRISSLHRRCRPVDDDGEDIEDLMLDAALGAVESIPRASRKDLDMVQEAIRRAVRAAANSPGARSRVVTVFVTRI